MSADAIPSIPKGTELAVFAQIRNYYREAEADQHFHVFAIPKGKFTVVQPGRVRFGRIP